MPSRLAVSGLMDRNTRLTLDGLVNSILCALGKLTDFLVLERGEKGRQSFEVKAAMTGCVDREYVL